MTREQLLEFAVLDVYGLLDEYDAALYTRSFHHAPVAVQDEVRELQATLAADVALVPDEAPSPELRQAVLDRVSRAIEQDSRRLAPIATIGPRRAERRASGRRESLLQMFFGGSGHFWRAAAFVLCGAVIVLAYFWSEAYRHGNEVSRLAMNKTTNDQLVALIGPTFEDFVGNPNCTTIGLRPVAEGHDGAIASMYHNERTEKAFLLVLGLPERDAAYTLRRVDEDGGSEIVQAIEAVGTVIGVRVDDITRGLFATATWEIVDAEGAVVMRGTARA